MKNQIVEKTRTLFLRYGVKSVTMDDVARELGISKKTLYQHFENKSDLLRSIGEFYLERDKNLLAQIRREGIDAIDEMLRITGYVLEEVKEIMSPTLIFDLKKYYYETWQIFEKFQYETIYNHIRSNLERGITEGLYRADIEPDIIAKIHVGRSFVLIDDDFFPQKHYNRFTLFKQNFVYHVRGIATEKGLKLLDERIKQLDDMMH